MIYVVEDDASIRELELYALKNSGYEAMGFETGKEFYAACEKELPGLVLLDIMLPDEDGLSILESLRTGENTAEIPVIMVTAKTTEIDRVKGLDAGADDYIIKPFGVMELVSRVKSLLRRTTGSNRISGNLCYEGIVLDDRQHLVTVDEKNCVLTYKEYELLKLLLLNAGIVFTRDKLMNEIWGFNYEGESRTVDVHIKTLRQKLGEAGSAIKTVRNVGYKIGK